jgi:hypothetical protein
VLRYRCSVSRCLFGLFILTACSAPDTGPEYLDNYTKRLSTAAGEALAAHGSLIAPPRVSDAAITPIPIDNSSINVLDFLSLADCELQVNIGRRNSLLGRHASPSQQLLLDLEFLALAPACIKILSEAGESTLASSLEVISQNKQNQLAPRIFNALFTDVEWRDFWRLPAALQSYPDNTGGDLLDSLHWLDRQVQVWLSGEQTADAQELERHLAVIRTGDGGYLLLAAALQARELERASATLQQRGHPLCPGGSATEASRIIERVVLKYFIGDVQPWLANLNRREHEILTIVRSIETQLGDTLTPAYQAWRTARDELLDKLKNVPLAHIAVIKTVLSDCHGLQILAAGAGP